jgi:hypothetical protein
LGKAAGFEGDSPGADVFAFAGPIIFPQNQQGTRAIEALSFRASQAGDQEASPFAVGAVSVVAPVQIPTSSPASVQ